MGNTQTAGEKAKQILGSQPDDVKEALFQELYQEFLTDDAKARAQERLGRTLSDDEAARAVGLYLVSYGNDAIATDWDAMDDAIDEASGEAFDSQGTPPCTDTSLSHKPRQGIQQQWNSSLY